MSVSTKRLVSYLIRYIDQINMPVQNYPSSGSLIVTFLENVKRYRVNRISGINPSLINFNGIQMYIYIRNLSPAQLSNDNPDIWRIQLPKRDEFEPIKKSDKLFVLFGYDHIRKVYTSWNPYWCKQRLNVAESCSMYSRLSLQRLVSSTQRIEKIQLQNDGDVVCVPASLLGNYLKNLKEYYPEESTYTPVGSSIQKRKQDNVKSESVPHDNDSIALFDKFVQYYNNDDFKSFLLKRGTQEVIASFYIDRLNFIFEQGYINKYKYIFLDYSKLKDYKRAINRFCWQRDVRYYEDLWNISSILKMYILFVETKINKNDNIKVIVSTELNTAVNNTNDFVPQQNRKYKSIPHYTLDEFGKLVALDAFIVEKLLPQVRGVDYPDYESIIKQVKEYYPLEATERMTPADWMQLFDTTKWHKKRGRKTVSTNSITEVKRNKQKGEVEHKEQSSNNIETSVIINKSIDTKRLESIFDKKVTSYKYFWFISIITLIKKQGSLTIPYSDIVIKMASIAWPIVMGDGIELGERDMMMKYLKDIKKKAYLINATSSNVVESTLSKFYNILGIKDILSPLLNNVPYRFLSPWVKFTTNSEVMEVSKGKDFDGPYSLYDDGIVLNSEWSEYFKTHYNELCSFSLQSFINYVKQYNNDLKILRLMKSGWGV